MIENTLKSSFIARWIRKALPLFLLFSGFAFGQANYSPAELDTLVSTIALYPDPLLVHVLTASTYGDQIPAANAFAQSHKNEKGETLAKSIEDANLTYDPSVQALIPFPTVLDMMAKYPTWTDQLGDDNLYNLIGGVCIYYRLCAINVDSLTSADFFKKW